MQVGNFSALHRPAMTASQKALLKEHRDRRAKWRGVMTPPAEPEIEIQPLPAVVASNPAPIIPDMSEEIFGPRVFLAAHAADVARVASWSDGAEVFGPLVCKRKITVERIQEAVARKYSLSREKLLSGRKTCDVARPRQVAMYLAKKFTNYSLPEIGRRFAREGKATDHTTVIHSIQRIAIFVSDLSVYQPPGRMRDAEFVVFLFDAQLAKDIEDLKRELQAI